MLFSKLGEILKKTTDKIASAIFVDKKLIDSIIKDLQRALIEADVNVALVKELSDKIRQAAIDEKIKGIEKKEQIIKLLHDELLEMLGGEKAELKLEKGKQTKILLLGLYGSGKCVHPESNIQLSDGNIIKIENLYEKYKKYFKEEELEDGKIINISNANLFVPSFNPLTAKIENKKATHLWRLNKKELIEVKADNGNDFSIKVTPEHPFFALKNGQITQIRADEITENDFIALPREIEIKGIPVNISNKIKNLDLFVYLNKEDVKGILAEKNLLIKEIHKNLRMKVNYCQLTKDLKEGKIPIELVNLEKYNLIKTKSYESKEIITIPLFLNSEFSEFLGYLMGDGHIDKNYVEIVTEDIEIIERIKYLSKNLFNLELRIKKDTRTRAMNKLVLCSKTLVKLLSIFNLKPGRKGKQLKIPEEILLSDNEIIRSFIRAYFDCDSHPSKNRSIELSSESNILIKQMNILLNRFGIVSTISKKIVNNIPYWRLIIKSKFAEIYADKIGYLIERKQKRIDNYKLIGTNQGCGDQNMLPLGGILREIREKLGFSIGEIQTDAVLSYGRYEEEGFISREHLKKLVYYYKTRKLGRFFQILESISNGENIYEKYSNAVINGLIGFLKNQDILSNNPSKIILTERGNIYLEQLKQNNINDLLTKLELLSESNVIWASIKEVKQTANDKEVVYDLTVEDNHSFIAEGFIVHNTTTIAKLANYYAKRGLKTCMLGLDVHRPAAPEQLEQLAERNNLTAFIDKNEKNPEKIYEKFEKQLRDYDLVLVDTAGRHSLDKDLIDEIKSLGKKIKPDYIILVIAADIGQAAKTQASEFQKALNINGVIVTRMDSSAKGGGALTACNETKAKVFFITTGEKINDLETFSPSSFISRILGMGDLETLLEKIKSVTTDKEQEKLKKRLEEGKFTMDDLLEQLESVSKVGTFDKIMELIPGLGNVKAKIPENMLGVQEEKMKKFKFAIQSMTPEEKENPEIIEKQTSRIQRIAKGSGTSTSDVRALLKQYKILKDFIKTGEDVDLSKGVQGFSQKQLQKFAKKFGKKMRI